jgi:hypothetical protein
MQFLLMEARPMDFANHEQHSYAVEVSGWDVSETFFVERTDLTWAPGAMKKIRLRHPVREGGLVFVRLLQPAASTENYPIACQAVNVMERAPDGCAVLRLAQLRPRAFFRDTARESNCDAMRVA